MTTGADGTFTGSDKPTVSRRYRAVVAASGACLSAQWLTPPLQRREQRELDAADALIV